MKPYKATFYIYAENEQDVITLQQELNNLVRTKYDSGILVTAPKLTNALRKFGANVLVNNFLKR